MFLDSAPQGFAKALELEREYAMFCHEGIILSRRAYLFGCCYSGSLNIFTRNDLRG